MIPNPDRHITGEYGEALYVPEEGYEAYTDDTEPDEDSVTTEDWRNFYLYGKLAFTVGEDENITEGIQRGLDSLNFWPNVYWLSDHGNAHRIDYSTDRA